VSWFLENANRRPASIAAWVFARAANAVESVICAATTPSANGNNIAAMRGLEPLVLVADEMMGRRIEAYLTKILRRISSRSPAAAGKFLRCWTRIE
jgi:hypothetical protein